MGACSFLALDKLHCAGSEQMLLSQLLIVNFPELEQAGLFLEVMGSDRQADMSRLG